MSDRNKYGPPPRYPEPSYGGQQHFDGGPYPPQGQGAAADYYGSAPRPSPYNNGPYGGPPQQGYYGGPGGPGGPQQGMHYGPPGPGYAPQGRFAGQGQSSGPGNSFMAACFGTLALCCCLDCLF